MMVFFNLFSRYLINTTEIRIELAMMKNKINRHSLFFGGFRNYLIVI